MLERISKAWLARAATWVFYGIGLTVAILVIK